MRNDVTASKSLQEAAETLPGRIASLKARGTGRGGHHECAVCRHEQRQVINEALIGKVPLRLLAKTYGMSIAALSRHSKNHLTHTTPEERKQRMLDHLLAKCNEFEARELERAADDEASDEVLGVIDDFRQELLEVRKRPWM